MIDTMPVAVPTSIEQPSGMEYLQVADLDVYRDPSSSEEAKLTQCKKVGSVW